MNPFAQLEPSLLNSALLAALGAYACSLLATWVWMQVAPRLGFIDRPGARRLHRQPIPRGGGIGIVLITVLALVWIEPFGGASAAVALATLALAVAGLYDDWSGAGVLWRLIVQLGSAAVLAAALLLPEGGGTPWLALIVATLVTAAWVNVFNFMDGANGMAGQQGLFLSAVALVLAALAGQTPWVLFALALAGGVLGFLPFNLPQARVFLGDVGSTTLGFALATALGGLIASGAMAPGEAVLAASAFLIDTAATWSARVSRGRGWYTPHREHLYQWLVRSGYSHLEVAAIYAAWNFLVVAPLLILGRMIPEAQSWAVGGGLMLGLGFWFFGRGHALARRRARRH